MVDIASLAIKIDTSDAARAGQELDKLAGAGKKAETAAGGVARAWDDAAQAVASTATPAKAVSAALTQNNAALRLNASVMERAGLSAGQYQQALRTLPMQLTDVSVSLASGMPLWLVAIQQGGQIRDSFGGIGNAARAVVSTLGPLNLAFGGVAATLGALLLAYQQGQNEAQAYQQALILTGNAAGTSADQLANMAQAMDEMGGTQRQAAEALAEVAATGKIAADQIQLVAQSAIDMERATGRSVSETVKEFVKLADEPAAAAAKLNEQYNFLTGSVYEQIRALEEQGRTTEAAKLATDTYAAAVQQRAAQVEGSLGLLQRGWRSVTSAAAEAWDAMLNVGRPDTLEEQLAAVEERIRNAQSRTGMQASRGASETMSGLEQERTRLLLLKEQRDTEAAWQGELAGINKDSVDAQQKLNAALDRSAGNADKLKQRYREIDEQVKAAAATGVIYSEAQIRQLREAAEKQFRDPAPRRQRAFTDDAATRMLQGLRDQEASLQAQLESTVTLSTAQRAQVEWAQQLADLKNKSILTADQKSLLANQEAVTAQLAKNAALDYELRKQEERAELAERIARVDEASWSDASRALYAYQQQVETLQAGVLAGVISEEQRDRIVAGLDEQAAAAEKSADQMTVFMDEAARNIQGAFADFLFDPFSEGLDGMAIGFAKVVQRMAAEAAAAQLANQLFGVADAGGSRSGGLLQSGLSAVSGLFANAKGNAFAGGEVIPFAKGGTFTNSIVDSPTLFPFAKGTGLMGEAGPEAIMPLTRAADGSLGVRAMGGGGSAPIVINASVTVQAKPGMSSQEAASQGAQMGQAMTAEIRKNISNELRPGGQIWRAINGR